MSVLPATGSSSAEPSIPEVALSSAPHLRQDAPMPPSTFEVMNVENDEPSGFIAVKESERASCTMLPKPRETPAGDGEEGRNPENP